MSGKSLFHFKCHISFSSLKWCNITISNFKEKKKSSIKKQRWSYVTTSIVLALPFSPFTRARHLNAYCTSIHTHFIYYIAHTHYLALSLVTSSPTRGPQLLFSCLLMRVREDCGGGRGGGMIWPAGVSPWAQRPLHRSIMHTLMAVKWLARNEK